MGEFLTYRKEVTRSLNFLAEDSRTLFLCQTFFGGSGFTAILKDLPENKKIELPPTENMQMGISIGLSFEGIIPITTFLRHNFLLLALDQLVNHLDNLVLMGWREPPKLIVRTLVGATKPLLTGPQHSSNFTDSLKAMIQVS